MVCEACGDDLSNGMTQKRVTVLSQLAENKGLGFDGVIIQLKLRAAETACVHGSEHKNVLLCSTIMYYSYFWAESL